MKIIAAIQQYKDTIDNILTRIMTEQLENIEQVAKVLAEVLSRNGIIYITGSGHSHMIAEEIFYRAGGLAAVYPILEPSLMLHESAVRSSEVEKMPGYAAILLNNLAIVPQDALIVISNSGRNSYPVEMALEGKKLGCPTIAITSLSHSSMVDSRHQSGKRLYEVADLVLDNCGVYGDAAIEIADVPAKMGATSTIAAVFLIQSAVLRTVEIMQQNGIIPEVFVSANVDAVDDEDRAAAIIKKWRSRIHIL